MNPDHVRIIDALSGCRVLPGSFDKKILKLWSLKIKADEPMTKKGVSLLLDLLQKYRNQVPETYKRYQHLIGEK